MTFDPAKIRAIASAAIPPNAPSRTINFGNEVWGPRLKAFKNTVWPEDILALLDENDSLRAEVERLRGMVDGLTKTASECNWSLVRTEQQLSAALAAKDEACEIGENWTACGLEYESDELNARRDLNRLACLRTIGKDGGNG